MNFRTVARWLLKPIIIPQYVPVGLQEPQALVRVVLRWADQAVDVTTNNVVVSLRPLTLGVMSRGSSPAPNSDTHCDLEFVERRNGHRLGSIRLRPSGELVLSDCVFYMYRIVGSRNDCLYTGTRAPYAVYERWRAWRRQKRNPFNFFMTSRDAQALFVFYICPRPVVLVTAEYEGRCNIFPMDLIGTTDSPWFTLALRSTSPAVELIRRSKRMALASIPLEYCGIAYRLGRHHGQQSIDLDQLPFPLQESLLFHMPVPAHALRIREVHVECVEEVGSHTLFITSIAADEASHSVAQGGSARLFHVHGSFRRHLAENNIPIDDETSS